jgi:hypothetical protein
MEDRKIKWRQPQDKKIQHALALISVFNEGINIGTENLTHVDENSLRNTYTAVK